MRGLLAITLTTAMLWSIPSIAQPSVQEALDVGPEHVEEEESGVNSGAVSIEAGFEYSSKYIFRGLLVEDQGAILWPWIELAFTFFESEGAFSSLSLTLGNWNSLHYGNETGTRDCSSDCGDECKCENPDPAGWFESDAYIGLALGFIEALELSVVYISYMSPNGSFRTLKEMVFGISYDDSGFWENIGVFEGIYPWITLAVEIAGQGDAGTGEGIYLEIGVEPTLELGTDDYSLSVAVPLFIGMSLRDYFEAEDSEDSVFGFFEAAVVIGLPLTFIPETFGEWTLSGNFHLTVLSTQAQEIGETDQLQLWGGLGLGFSY